MKVLVVLVLIAVSGCSWMVTRSPTTPMAIAREGCPSKAPAGIDAYLAASNGAGALLMFGMADDLGNAGSLAIATGLVSAGLAVAHAASAHHGFKEVRRCRETRNALYEPPLYAPAYVGPPGAVGVPPDEVDVEIEPNDMPPVTIEQQTETETIETRTRTNTKIRIDRE